MLDLETNKPEVYKKLKNMIPELGEKSEPQDRSFFFNILNTLDKDVVDKMVFNTVKVRSTRNRLDTEIEMQPEL